MVDWLKSLGSQTTRSALIERAIEPIMKKSTLAARLEKPAHRVQRPGA